MEAKRVKNEQALVRELVQHEFVVQLLLRENELIRKSHTSPQ